MKTESNDGGDILQVIGFIAVIVAGWFLLYYIACFIRDINEGMSTIHRVERLMQEREWSHFYPPYQAPTDPDVKKMLGEIEQANGIKPEKKKK